MFPDYIKFGRYSLAPSVARVASTEEKTIGAAIGTVGGLVTGMK